MTCLPRPALQLVEPDPPAPKERPHRDTHAPGQILDPVARRVFETTKPELRRAD